jgi:hypothetical protein
LHFMQGHELDFISSHEPVISFGCIVFQGTLNLSLVLYMRPNIITYGITALGNTD